MGIEVREMQRGAARATTAWKTWRGVRTPGGGDLWGREGLEGTEAGGDIVLLGKVVGDEPRFLPRIPRVLVVWPRRLTSTVLPLFHAGPYPAH